MVKLRFAFGFAKAFILNSYAEWRNTRLENSKRRWSAHKLGGGGVVPLGKVNQETAIEKTSLFGNVVYVDTSVAIVFYSDKFAQ